MLRAVLCLMIVCLLAPPAGGHHDDSVMQIRNGEVVWVTSNVIWHYNPWECRESQCLWPDNFRHPNTGNPIKADVPIFAEQHWTTRQAEGDRQILLLEQPWAFIPNIDRSGAATVWDRGAVAVSNCPEHEGVSGRNCGHKSPSGFGFYPEHRTGDSERRGLHGDDPPPDPKGGPPVTHNVPPEQENSADRHEVFGVCVKPEGEFAGLSGDALIAAWLAHHDRIADLAGWDKRTSHDEMQGWSAAALKSFSYVSNTQGQIVRWQDTMDPNQVMSVEGFHGTGNAVLQIDPGTKALVRSNGLVSTCVSHIDKNGGPCDPAVHKLNTTEGIINDNPNPVLDRCKDSCYHGAWANYDALDHLPDTNTARQAAYEADHSIVPHPWIHPWGRPGQGGWAPGANPNAVRQFEPPPDKYWVLQPPDWDYTLDVPAGQWEWTPHPDDPGDHPDSPWPVCVFMSAI